MNALNSTDEMTQGVKIKLANTVGVLADTGNDMPLTFFENERLSHLEGVVSSGIDSFISVGLALAEIKDSKLYRNQYRTFDEYCRSRWNIAARTAYQCIKSASTCKLLDGLPLPANENVARVLSEIPEDERRNAWVDAIKVDPRITAEDLRLLLLRTRRKSHESQPLPKVTETVCPKCAHVFVPHFPEKASRGDRRPSWCIPWAAGILGTNLSAIDYGCGRMRNVGSINGFFNLLAVVDTPVQVERVRHLTDVPCYSIFDNSVPLADVCFCVSVLHIIDDDAASLACGRMSKLSRFIVVEVPKGARYYKDRHTSNYYREPDESSVSSWLPDFSVISRKTRAYSQSWIFAHK